MMHQITPLAQYAHHFGIDVSKDHLDIHHLETGRSWRIPNRVEAIRAFITEQASALREALVVVDCTGGYELACCERMVAAGVRVHRTNTYQFRSYVRSCGQLAKTDRLDARMLAQYGRERGASLRLFVPEGRIHRELRQLVIRRDQLVRMRVSEQNRLQAPENAPIRPSIERVVKALTAEIKRIEDKMRRLVQRDEALARRRDLLMEIPGVGEVIATALVVLMPELGHVNRRQVAALGGLAPYARDSGRWQGQRHVGAGRSTVRRLMFMAAQVARRHNPEIREFCARLEGKGKKPIVALTAAARKMLVIINARLRDALKAEGAEAAEAAGHTGTRETEPA